LALGDNTRYFDKTSRAKVILKILNTNAVVCGAGD
jgi:hypothetical protein